MAVKWQEKVSIIESNENHSLSQIHSQSEIVAMENCEVRREEMQFVPKQKLHRIELAVKKGKHIQSFQFFVKQYYYSYHSNIFRRVVRN